MEKIRICNDDIKAFCFLYRYIQYVLKTEKGLKFKQAFQLKKMFNSFKTKYNNYKVNDYIDFEEGVNL